MLRTTPKSRLLERKLLGLLADASRDYQLLSPHDHVLVAVSGGKDSHVLLYLLRQIQRRAPFPFTFVAVNVDQKQPGFPSQLLPRYFEEEGYPHHIVEDDTYSIVREKIPEGQTACSLCSRLRRGILYNVAVRLGATKIALGHHLDDAIETLLLNLLYAGQLKSMPARLLSDDGRNTVIRPLITCAEQDIAELAEEKGFPLLPCGLCSSQPNLKRRAMKELIASLSAENPHVRSNMLSALTRVCPSHLLDRKLLAQLGTAGTSEMTESAGEPVVPLRLERNAAPQPLGLHSPKTTA